MFAFRLLLGAIAVALTLYTSQVIAVHGWGLAPIFFGDIARMAWPGQFNLDFTFMLALSALWVSWRHRFSPAGLGLGFLAFIGGASFLSVYLLVQSFRTRGDVKVLLLGDRAR